MVTAEADDRVPLKMAGRVKMSIDGGLRKPVEKVPDLEK
jgi:hypothetical protein